MKKQRQPEQQWQLTKVLLMKITIIAMMTSVVFAAKLALDFLPNVELITFFFVIFCLFFRWEIALGIVNCSCAIMMLYYGIADWSIMYFIIFNLYALITISSKFLIVRYWWICVILTALMGYLFGSLFFFKDLLLFDFSYALSHLLWGWLFDFIHGTANAILTIILFPILYRFMSIINDKWNFLINHTYQHKFSQEKQKKEH